MSVPTRQASRRPVAAPLGGERNAPATQGWSDVVTGAAKAGVIPQNMPSENMTPTSVAGLKNRLKPVPVRDLSCLYADGTMDLLEVCKVVRPAMTPLVHSAILFELGEQPDVGGTTQHLKDNGSVALTHARPIQLN